MTATLSELLKPSEVDFEALEKEFKPMLSLVRELIGVVPNCDTLLEIWSPGFRTYNLIVPNLLNLPATLWGGESLKSTMGLAMYAASRAAECPYCTAHTCSFALRRGAGGEAILGNGTPAQKAAMTVATTMSTIPADLTREDYEEMTRHFNPDEIEQIILSVCMMGFLNKFMDAMDVELEAASIADVEDLLSNTGWKPKRHEQAHDGALSKLQADNFFTYLRVITHAPGAVMMERKWTKDIPHAISEIESFLKTRTGYHFPVFRRVTKKRAVRALTAVLSENLNTENTQIGLHVKCMASIVFATVVENDMLKKEAEIISKKLAPALTKEKIDAISRIARHDIPVSEKECESLIVEIMHAVAISEKEATAVLLSLAASGSPAKVNAAIISKAGNHFTHQEIVELVVWLSVQQLFHRLHVFYAVA